MPPPPRRAPPARERHEGVHHRRRRVHHRGAPHLGRQRAGAPEGAGSQGAAARPCRELLRAPARHLQRPARSRAPARPPALRADRRDCCGARGPGAPGGARHRGLHLVQGHRAHRAGASGGAAALHRWGAARWPTRPAPAAAAALALPPCWRQQHALLLLCSLRPAAPCPVHAHQHPPPHPTRPPTHTHTRPTPLQAA